MTCSVRLRMSCRFGVPAEKWEGFKAEVLSTSYMSIVPTLTRKSRITNGYIYAVFESEWYVDICRVLLQLPANSKIVKSPVKRFYH